MGWLDSEFRSLELARRFTWLRSAPQDEQALRRTRDEAQEWLDSSETGESRHYLLMLILVRDISRMLDDVERASKCQEELVQLVGESGTGASCELRHKPE